MINKYLRAIQPAPSSNDASSNGVVHVDVYCVLDAFSVSCPATQHAVKKLLCAGIRGEKSTIQDLKEAKESIERAIEMEMFRSK